MMLTMTTTMTTTPLGTITTTMMMTTLMATQTGTQEKNGTDEVDDAKKKNNGKMYKFYICYFKLNYFKFKIFHMAICLSLKYF